MQLARKNERESMKHAYDSYFRAKVYVINWKGAFLVEKDGETWETRDVEMLRCRRQIEHEEMRR
jgi:hypothetical protein